MDTASPAARVFMENESSRSMEWSDYP